MKTFRSVLVLLVLTACGGEAPGVPADDGDPVDVVVSHVVRGAAPSTHPATLAAERTADVATRTSARIERVEVDVGSRVTAGDTLLVLDAEDVRARLEAARARATLAERSFRRIESLAADRAASRQELDEARSRLEAARSDVDAARSQLAYVVVRAPFDGVVEARMAEPGGLAAPGVPLLSLVGGSVPIVEADLPSEIGSHLRAGDTVGVLFPGGGPARSATITRVAPALEPGSRRVRVEARFDERPIDAGPPGTYVRLAVPGRGDETTWIPADAVVRSGQLEGVYSLEGSELRLRWLRLGRRSGDAVEVLAGPARLEAVVRSLELGLTDGARAGTIERRPWSPLTSSLTSSPGTPRAGATPEAAGAERDPDGVGTAGRERSGDATPGGPGS